jgi:diaminopimelate decarboxylase
VARRSSLTGRDASHEAMTQGAFGREGTGAAEDDASWRAAGASGSAAVSPNPPKIGWVLDLFPDSAAAADCRLTLGGLPASDLAAEHGTPLLVLCRETMLARARAYMEAAPGALVAYSVKAFPNVAVLRLLAGEGLGADVSTLGELAYAREAGIPGERIVVHGNNKSDEELAAAAEADAAYVVLDAADEVGRAVTAGVRRVLVRVTPGIDADTHPAVRTGHHGSKFGLSPEEAIAAIADAREAGLDVAGVHVHLGSQLLETRIARASVDWLSSFAGDCRAELDWTPRVVDLGGGLGIQYVDDEPAPSVEAFVGAVIGRLEHEWDVLGLPKPEIVLEPGRSLVGDAGVALYRVGVVKQASESTTYVAIDGGMSDNPRPQLYGARLSAVLADRIGVEPDRVYTVCGKHCESGDVLVDRVSLPAPERGDVLAVPAAGAYTLAMASNYNGVPRPAAVLVADGEARVIRRRETLDDLLSFEADA